MDPNMTQLILDHPLYPLLQMVFQKCELATSSPRDSQTETICSSESFSEDIRNFINEARLRNIPLTTQMPEVDKFMLKSIEVLRIHLLELEKVHQLCDNFCTRYINCLKGKLPIDQILDDGSSRDTNSASRNGNGQDGPSTSNNHHNGSGGGAGGGPNNNGSTSSHNGQNGAGPNGEPTTNGHHHHQAHQHHQHSNHQSAGGNELANGYQSDSASAAAAAAAAYHHNPYGYQVGYGASGGADHRAAMNPYAAHHAAYAVSQAALHAGSASNPHYEQLHHSSSNTSSSLKQEQPATPNSNNHLHHHHHQQRELTASSSSSSASSVKLERNSAGSNAGNQFANETQSSATSANHEGARSPAGSTGKFSGDTFSASVH